MVSQVPEIYCGFSFPIVGRLKSSCHRGETRSSTLRVCEAGGIELDFPLQGRTTFEESVVSTPWQDRSKESEQRR